MKDDHLPLLTIAIVAMSIMGSVFAMVSCEKDADRELTKRQIIAGGTNGILYRNDRGELLLPQNR